MIEIVPKVVIPRIRALFLLYLLVSSPSRKKRESPISAQLLIAIKGGMVHTIQTKNEKKVCVVS